jgi:VWFA-related protein
MAGIDRRSAALAACLLAPRLWAEQPPLRVTTRLVEVSVVAETKEGQAVADLKQEEFRLFDQGREQRIAAFAPPAAARPAPARPLPPNTFSNRLDKLGAPAGATVILFDGLNTRLTDQAYARRQVLKFLRQLRPGERVALYVLGRGPRILQDFTSDVAAVRDALEKFQGEPSPSLDFPLYDPAVSAAEHFGAWLGELAVNLIEHFEEDRAFRTARSLIAIAQHLERLPGRKNLLWVSGSFPISIELEQLPRPSRSGRRPRSISPEVERAARALNNANLAVYPIDARGLMAPQEYRADLAAAAEHVPGRDQAMFATMRLLARRTGGRAFYNNNDLYAALRRATEDAGRAYVLSYYPSHEEWNGRFRELKVEVSRPGVELHYRGGYFAQPDEPAEPWYREQVLESALWSPLDATRIGLGAHVVAAAPGKLDLELDIDAPDLLFQPAKGELWECRLDLWLVQLDGRDNQVGTYARTNNLRLNRATYERVQAAGGLRLVEHLDLAPEAKLVRVLVRDLASGALGSLTIPLERLRPAGRPPT